MLLVRIIQNVWNPKCFMNVFKHNWRNRATWDPRNVITCRFENKYHISWMVRIKHSLFKKSVVTLLYGVLNCDCSWSSEFISRLLNVISSNGQIKMNITVKTQDDVSIDVEVDSESMTVRDFKAKVVFKQALPCY